MKNLHEEFYDFRDRVWKELEKLVQTGCEIEGEFPIQVGEYSLPKNGLREYSVLLADTTELTISGIRANPDYSIHEEKENDHDIHVDTNRIVVLIKRFDTAEGKFITSEVEVEPDILNLQCLSTYLSGGFSVYYE